MLCSMPLRSRLQAIIVVAILLPAHPQALADPAAAVGGPSWRVARPLIEGPGARFGHALVYDPLHDRMLLFGGTDGRVPMAGLWALALSDTLPWVPLSPSGTGPNPRMGHTMIFDPTPPRVILFGGWGLESGKIAPYVDAWALDLRDSLHWELLHPNGKSPTAPLNHHSAIYDPVRDRMVVFGGGKDDVWTLSLGQQPEWTRLSSGGKSPPGLEGHSAVYDLKRDRMLVFGGAAGNYSPLMKLVGNPPTRTSNEVWALSLNDPPMWSRLEPRGTRPSERYYHTATMDTLRDRMLIFSGGHSRGWPVADLWALSLGEPLTWTRLTPTGSYLDQRHKLVAAIDTGRGLIAARRMHAAAVDSRRECILLSGGAVQGNYESWFGPLGDEWWFSMGGSDSLGSTDRGQH